MKKLEDVGFCHYEESRLVGDDDIVAVCAIIVFAMKDESFVLGCKNLMLC